MIKLEIYTTEQKVDNYYHDQAWSVIMRKYGHLSTQERREKFLIEFPHHPIDYSHPHKSPAILHPDYPSDRRRISSLRTGGFDDAVKSLLPDCVDEQSSINKLFAPLRLEHTHGWLNISHLPKLAYVKNSAQELSTAMHQAAERKGDLTALEADAVILSDILIEFLDEAISLLERDRHIFMEKY